jgi:uncharacterized protein (DUF2141 family)
MAYTFDFGTKFAAPILALAALGTALGSATLADAAAPVGASTLTINVSGLRNAKGNVLVCVTANKKYFPDCSKDPASHRARVKAKSASAISFSGVKAGTYAAALMHDENANDKLDTAVLLPKEGFGFSRNPAVVTGPPKFKSAAFTVGEGSASQTVKMKYML